MTVPGSTTRTEAQSAGSRDAPFLGGDSSEPVTTLRGARVEVNGRRVGQVFIGVCLATLAVLAVVFYVVGADKNAQINELRQQGVGVEITVSGCLGLLGGSGSNAGGYACHGTYEVGGHRYNEAIPGDLFRSPGTTLRGVVGRSDPKLVSTAADVASEHASWNVFVVPTILLLVLVLAVGAIAARHRVERSRRVRRLPA